MFRAYRRDRQAVRTVSRPGERIEKQSPWPGLGSGQHIGREVEDRGGMDRSQRQFGRRCFVLVVSKAIIGARDIVIAFDHHLLLITPSCRSFGLEPADIWGTSRAMTGRYPTDRGSE